MPKFRITVPVLFRVSVAIEAEDLDEALEADWWDPKLTLNADGSVICLATDIEAALEPPVDFLAEADWEDQECEEIP